MYEYITLFVFPETLQLSDDVNVDGMGADFPENVEVRVLCFIFRNGKKK